MSNVAERVFKEFPVLQVNDTIYLRQMTYNDTEDYLEYLQDEDVNRYVPEECLPRSLDQARNEIDYNLDLFRYRLSLYWAVALCKDNKLIGSCGFNYWNRDHARTEISYDLHKKYWGRGLMTEAARTILTYGFTHMELHRVEATVTPTNIGSQRVLKKLGFKKEGVLREQKLLHGAFHDAIMMSILQKEYVGF